MSDESKRPCLYIKEFVSVVINIYLSSLTISDSTCLLIQNQKQMALGGMIGQGTLIAKFLDISTVTLGTSKEPVGTGAGVSSIAGQNQQTGLASAVVEPAIKRELFRDVRIEGMDVPFLIDKLESETSAK